MSESDILVVPKENHRFLMGIPRKQFGKQGYWRSFYHFGDMLFLLSHRFTGNYNTVRDQLRKQYEETAFMDLHRKSQCEVMPFITDDWVFYRVDTGNLVDPDLDYTNNGFKLHPSQGFADNPLAASDDQIEPLGPKKASAKATAKDRIYDCLSHGVPRDVVNRALEALEKIPEPTRIAEEVAVRKPAPVVSVEDPAKADAERFPAYWKPIPSNWQYIDTYRIGHLFPIHADPSGRLMHARKKLLVPGVRTGGKSLYKDVHEAMVTLQAWLRDNPEDQANG